MTTAYERTQDLLRTLHVMADQGWVLKNFGGHLKEQPGRAPSQIHDLHLRLYWGRPGPPPIPADISASCEVPSGRPN